MKYRAKKMFSLISVLILVLCSLCQSKPGKICQNPSGKNVDWYVVFLFPETATQERELYYGYFDATSTEMAYYKYADSSFPGIKVVQGFEDGKTNYFFWNDDQSTDDDSKSASSGKAHSKGGLIFNETEGLLFSHSLPRFPRRKDESTIMDSLPLNGGVYG
jgi:hypothetical protein